MNYEALAHNKKRSWQQYYLAIALLAYLTPILVAFIYPKYLELALTVAFVATGVAIVSYIIEIFMWSNFNRKNFEQFAADNGFEFVAEEYSVMTKGAPFSYMGTGVRKNILLGSLGQFPIEAYEFKHTRDSKRTDSTRKHIQVVEVVLPRPLPQFIIDSKKAAVLPSNFRVAQKISLEGNFDSYFTLYAPQNYNIAALMLLAPDIMRTLIDHAADCDIEIVGNSLFFYWNDPAQSQAEIIAMFETVKAVVIELQKTLTTADIYTDNIQPYVVAQNGVKLKRKWFDWLSLLFTLLGVALFFAIYMYLQSITS